MGMMTPGGPVRRFVIVLMTVAALALTSCGGGSEPQELATAGEIPAPSTPNGSATDASPSTSTDSSITPDEAPADETTAAPESPAGAAGAKSVVLAALEKTSATGESMRMIMSMAVGGVPELGGGEATVSMTAAIADGGRRSHFSMDMSQLVDGMAGAPDIDPVEAEMMRSIFAQPLEFRVIDDTTYMTASLFSFFLPVDTPWVAFEADQSAADFGIADSTVDPGAFLALLRGVDDDAEVVGTEEIDGVSTTHIRGRLSVLEAISAAPEAERGDVQDALSGFEPGNLFDLSAELFEIDVWIDEGGLVRRISMGVDDLGSLDPTGQTSAGAYFSVVLDFTDHGTDIEIVEPPASEVTFLDESAFGLGA